MLKMPHNKFRHDILARSANQKVALWRTESKDRDHFLSLTFLKYGGLDTCLMSFFYGIITQCRISKLDWKKLGLSRVSCESFVCHLSQRGGWGGEGVIIMSFWSIFLDYDWFKKIYRPKMIVGSGATIHPKMILLLILSFIPSLCLHPHEFTVEWEGDVGKVSPAFLKVQNLNFKCLISDLFTDGL